MKVLIAIGLLLIAYVIGFSSPLPIRKPDIANHWGSAARILSMSFEHRDHTSDGCVDCHHNYVDDTGTSECMLCHVTDDRVSHVLREQFHDFCMGCHRERQNAGKPSGPVRRCIDCHIFDPVP